MTVNAHTRDLAASQAAYCEVKASERDARGLGGGDSLRSAARNIRRALRKGAVYLALAGGAIAVLALLVGFWALVAFLGER